VADSPDLVVGRRLLDTAKRHGFAFQRLAPGPDAPLCGVRETENWRGGPRGLPPLLRSAPGRRQDENSCNNLAIGSR
jgi:hypothetical protein